MVYCSDCGREALQGASFCHNCGARLSIEAVQAVRGQIETQARYPPRATDRPAPLLSRERKRIAITSVVAVLLIVVVIWAAASQGWIGFNVNQGSGNGGPTAQDGNYSVSFSWSYGGNVWSLSENVAATTYDSYHERPRSYEYTDFVTKDDPVVEGIARWLDGTAKNESYDPAQFVLSFVQDLRYGTDEETTGHSYYPRYPVETLVEGIGDCKSHTILYVSLMGSPEIGASVALLVLTAPQLGQDGHMAAGLAMPGLSGTYFESGGEQYYYCETTAPGWLIGEEPEQVATFSVLVIPV